MPFLERLIGDLSLHQQFGELPALRLALERHDSAPLGGVVAIADSFFDDEAQRKQGEHFNQRDERVKREACEGARLGPAHRAFLEALLDHALVREEQGLRPGGLGLVMTRALVDELIYNEARNEVVFIKYLD